jgi:hypothetical protein
VRNRRCLLTTAAAAGPDIQIIDAQVHAYERNHPGRPCLVWMAEPEVEAAWRAEFKRIGETQVRDALNSITDEPK